jgi:hypothetical protein
MPTWVLSCSPGCRHLRLIRCRHAYLDVVMLTWMSSCQVMGTSMGVIECFLFLYLGELGASKALMGLSLTVTCAAEVRHKSSHYARPRQHANPRQYTCPRQNTYSRHSTTCRYCAEDSTSAIGIRCSWLLFTKIDRITYCPSFILVFYNKSRIYVAVYR